MLRVQERLIRKGCYASPVQSPKKDIARPEIFSERRLSVVEEASLTGLVGHVRISVALGRKKWGLVRRAGCNGSKDSMTWIDLLLRYRGERQG